jgi:putative lipoic acid-binding regulatory protein
MRGEFDPPEHVENTERGSGVLLDSLLQFPAVYDFQLVIKQDAAVEGQALAAPEDLLERYRALIADTTAADIAPSACTAKPRLSGRYVSLCIPARVQAAHAVDLVWQALSGDAAVVMKF